MIDFRYHLVSLISVFLALAVGIVLGAGPLRENLGDQLAGQVEQLRTEAEQLRNDKEDLAARNDQLTTFIAEAGPQLVDTTLEGRHIVVLTDGDATRTAAERMNGLLDEADVASRAEVRLRSGLWDPAEAQTRAEALEQIRAIAPAVLPSSDAGALTDPALLAGTIPTLLDPEPAEPLPAELRSQVWQVLIDLQLVSIVGDLPERVDGIVVAAASPEELATGQDEQAAAEQSQNLLGAQTALVDALAGAQLPTVVSAVTPDNDGSTGILRTVRGNDAGQVLSTTDRLQEPDGPLLSILALVEQTRGGNGAYGTTVDADARMPELPETVAVSGQDAQNAQDGSAPSDGGGEGGADRDDTADGGEG